METDKDKNQTQEISAGITILLIVVAVTLVIMLGGFAYWFIAGDRSTEWSVISPILLVCCLLWVTLSCVIALVFLAVHFWIISRVKRTTAITQQKETRKKNKANRQTLTRDIAATLRKRYSLFWRRKVRLLLITGDDASIEQLVPGLQQQQWLEGNRTVLIYGGSLTSEPDREKFAALRKLRRGRPLDGIVRVMPQSLNLTPQISDNDLRGLEKISELLRYSAPVWLWKLCDSDWSQTNRTEQAVGASFSLRAKPDDITHQLESILPDLRMQGMS